jgi:hypothetical protein
MKTDGVANILSDAMLDSGVEAPLSTDLEYQAALAFYQMLQTYAVYAEVENKRWDKLTEKQKQAEHPDLVLAAPQYGALHHLITKGQLNVPAGWTISMNSSSNGSFQSENKTAYVELDVILLPLVEKVPQQKVGRPKKHGQDSQIITYRLFKSVGSLDEATFTLSVKGSGLFLLQGNTDYALPARLRTKAKDESEDTATELQMFVGAMKSPFGLLQSLAKVCVDLEMSRRPEVNDRIKKIVPFLGQLSNDKIRVRGFTFTRYMDFRHLKLKNIDIRQDFLRSLFLIYEAAKPNRKSFMNNGMKTYKSITTETRFEDEDLQKSLEAEYQEFSKNTDDPIKAFRKRSKSVSGIYSIRLTRSIVEKNRNFNSHHLTAIQFTVPRTLDRTKLGLDSEGANYLRDHCVKVRFSVFNRFLMDYKLKNLSDLIRYLCPDHKLETFRDNLDRLFHRVLEGYDYFYWVSRSWSWVVLPEDCQEWLDKVRRTAPKQVWQFLKLWASETAATTPDLHTLIGLVLRHYWPNAQDPTTGMIDTAILKQAEKKAHKIAKIVLAKYGLNIRYPRAFHITVADAFYSSTLNNLQSIQGLVDLGPKEKKALRQQTEKVLSNLSALHRPQNWNALALTMRKRQLNLVL